jgi:hypothetical protein
MLLKWAASSALLAISCAVVLAQIPVSQTQIEIAGVQVQPGITVSEALLLFKGKQVSRFDKGIYIEETVYFAKGTLQSIVGTLHLEKDVVTSACRNWDPSEDSADLARVLFAAVNASSSKEAATNAILETGVDRAADHTVETLLIRIGQRTIDISRQQGHRPMVNPPYGNAPPFVTVEECLSQPGTKVVLLHP